MNRTPPARAQHNGPGGYIIMLTDWTYYKFPLDPHATHMLLIKGFISFLCTHRLLLQSPLRELCLPPGAWKTFPCSLHTNLLWRTRGPHQTALLCNSSLNACFQNKPKRETNAYPIRRFWHVKLNKQGMCRICMFQEERDVSIRLTLLST